MEIAQQVKLRELESGTQTFIINGQQQTVTNKACCLVCPNCGKRIYQFEQNLAYLDAYQAIVASKANFEAEFKFCPVCGQKLEFTFDIINCEDYSATNVEDETDEH